MYNEKIMKRHLQWLKDNGKAKYELTDVFINNNGEFTKEKKMAWVTHTTPADWRSFCEVVGKKYYTQAIYY